MKEITEIEIEAFVQATEGAEKVVTAIKNIIPPELRDIEKNFTEKKVRGVFHNPIKIILARYMQNTRQILEYIAKQIKESDKRYLFRTLQRRIDKGNLYLRFGKQELYKNKIEIKEIKDIVKVKIIFSRNFSTLEKITKLLQEMELLIEA